jgi:hypothetical protein
MRKSRGVLDSPLARGMTAVDGAAPSAHDKRVADSNARKRQCTKWFADPCTISPASFTRRYSQMRFPRSFS